eukprot:NODE_4575_length_768_cov_9.290172_g4416_i0.p1 GENE.NODE_4575_length_768_cov_9.290172_g4416_i0~~NODE_4575_length_768_cov_9.290172_g4416_i0.p1  ORF type:complete len:190 (+),score=36.86 NODE_4575_length_768_cov_9.290172_g4416_i0:109-678(+)
MTSKISKMDFDDEGKKLMSRLTANRERYQNLSAIWHHPSGGVLYVGNHTAAQDRAGLVERNIYHIVNCQESTAPNYHEKDPLFTYLRFPISSWWSGRRMDTEADTVQYFCPYFTFVDEALQAGQSVLVHCLAGAHRAGAAGVAFHMRATRSDYRTSLEAVKQLRPIVNPMGHLETILLKLEKALPLLDR